MEKYYVYRFRKYFEFKRTKCNDYWSKKYADCWQYSKQGATNIVNTLNKFSKGFYRYGMIKVDEAEDMVAEFDKQLDKETYMAERMNERPWWI